MAYSPSRAFAYNGESNLIFEETSSSEQWGVSHSDVAMSNPTLSTDTLAGGWGFDGTIDPALLTQRNVLSDIRTHDAPMQQL